MYGCYVEVVFHFVAKAILFLCFFGFDIYPYILFHFFKCFLLFLLLLLLFTFFFSKIDFYVSGAIKVVLAQIPIYFKLNSGEQTSYCSVS